MGVLLRDSAHGLKGCDIVATCYGISDCVRLKVLNSHVHSGP